MAYQLNKTGAQIDAIFTKVDGIETSADVTDSTNVVSSLSGAPLTSATVTVGDKILIQDADASDALKVVTAQSVVDLFSVAETDVTQYEGSLTITESQISDLGSYITASSTDTLTNKTINGSSNTISNVSLSTAVTGNLPVTNLNSGTSASSSTFWRGDGTWASPSTSIAELDDIGDVTITSIASGEIIKWNGTSFVNNTLAEAGIAAASHTHTASEVTDLASATITFTNKSGNISQWTNDSGYITTYDVVETDVTQHESALTITESQISDLDHDAVKLRTVSIDASATNPSDGDILVYRTAGSDWVLEAKPAGGSNPAINDITDITITSVTDNEVLAYNSGTGEWINQTAAEAGLAIASHTHTASEVTDLATATVTFSNKSGNISQWTNDSGYITTYNVAETDVTQYESSLTITESQISDLGSYLTSVSTSNLDASTLVTESEGISSNDNDTSIPTSAAVKDLVDKQAETIMIAVSDENTALETGTAKATFRMPFAMTLTGVRASVTTAPTDATLTIDINESGSTILSTKLTIDSGEKTSTTAATAVVISDSSLADDAEITIDIDQVGSTVAGAGLKITLIGTRA